MSEELEHLDTQTEDGSSDGMSPPGAWLLYLGSAEDGFAHAGRVFDLADLTKVRFGRSLKPGELESELAEIRRTAADVLAINRQNKNLREQLAAEEIRVATLEQENRALTTQTTRYWFMAGALVLLFGILLGIWLPRIRWQRRSRYDRF